MVKIIYYYLYFFSILVVMANYDLNIRDSVSAGCHNLISGHVYFAKYIKLFSQSCNPTRVSSKVNFHHNNFILGIRTSAKGQQLSLSTKSKSAIQHLN